MSGTGNESTDVDADAHGASRFYWRWLIFATSMSVLGNITHAVLVAPGPPRVLAAIASVVPPAFVLGSTHSAGLSLKMRRFGLIYVLGLLMTISGWRPESGVNRPAEVLASVIDATRWR